MIQTFKLQKGEISFEPDRIRISDNSKKQTRFQLLSSGMWTIYGTLSVLRYLKTGDQFLLWTGLFLGIGHLAIFILNLFRTNENEILIDNIKLIKVKKISNNNILDIKLKNNRTRRVIGVENLQEIDDYIKTNIEIT